MPVMPPRLVNNSQIPLPPAARNWAGNVEFQAVRLAQPASLEELRDVVVSSDRVRVLGTGHSFNTLADTTGTLVRLDRWPVSVDIDESRATATVPAGARYAEVAAALHRAGFALANLASLPHITVAGAVATGTHGSGDRSRTLADAVVGVEFVDASGEVRRLSVGDPDFPGAVVALGALGVVTRLTLRIESSFAVAQEVRLDVPLDAFAGGWDEVFGAAYSVSAFTDYASGTARVWLKRRMDQPAPTWSGGRPADAPEHPVPGVDPVACTPQLGVPGPWHERLPHFRPDLVPSAGDELQSEYFVARTDAPAALAALRGIAAQVAPVLHIAEIRTIAADDLWLSPAYGRDSVGFHFTWIRDAAAVLPVVDLVEQALLPLGARPHWGKVWRADPAAVVARYPRAGDFAALRRRLDPIGKFANAYTIALFG
jgi:xylitol oxidase